MKNLTQNIKDYIENLELSEEDVHYFKNILKKIEREDDVLKFQIDSYKRNAQTSKALLGNIIHEIEEKNTRFQNTVNNLINVYFRTDFTGKLLQASPSICTKFEYDSLDEVIGKNVVDLFYKNSDDRRQFIEIISREGRVSNYPIDFLTKSGKVIHTELYCVIWKLPNGKPAGIEGIVNDVTDRFENEKRLKQLNEELQISLENIEEQKNQISHQNRILQRQTDLVIYQQDQLTKSIQYAQRIQQSVLPKLDPLETNFNDFFIIYKPSSIISGDFYFFKEIGDYFILSIADCTGHGVPGGFMTMLGMTFIDEIIRREDVTSPVIALSILREYVIRALNQGATSHVKDGMDLAMCAINKKTLEMEYAGANIPIFIKKDYPDFKKDIFDIESNENIVIQEDGLIEFKADRIPIGFYYGEREFTKFKVQLRKGDKIFITTDGFPDQFGGALGRKYLIKNFKKLINENHNSSMSDQKEIYENTLNDWKGDNDQIDDILVFGVQL